MKRFRGIAKKASRRIGFEEHLHDARQTEIRWGLVHFSAGERVLREERRPKTWTCPLPRCETGGHLRSTRMAHGRQSPPVLAAYEAARRWIRDGDLLLFRRRGLIAVAGPRRAQPRGEGRLVERRLVPAGGAASHRRQGRHAVEPGATLPRPVGRLRGKPRRPLARIRSRGGVAIHAASLRLRLWLRRRRPGCVAAPAAGAVLRPPGGGRRRDRSASAVLQSCLRHGRPAGRRQSTRCPTWPIA